MLSPHGLKALFHQALVIMEGDTIHSAKRCDKMGPNIYRIDGYFYNRDASSRPSNPNAPAIASIVSRRQARFHAQIGPDESYGGGGACRHPEYDFDERYSKKA